MSPEETRSFVMRIIESLNSGRFEDANSLVGASYVCHGPRGTYRLEDVHKYNRELVKGFPDMHITLEDAFSSEDRVAVRWSYRGTHTGPFRGKAPSGKTVEWRYLSIWRMSGGKVAEEWYLDDSLGLLQQLGVIPKVS